MKVEGQDGACGVYNGDLLGVSLTDPPNTPTITADSLDNPRPPLDKDS